MGSVWQAHMQEYTSQIVSDFSPVLLTYSEDHGLFRSPDL